MFNFEYFDRLEVVKVKKLFLPFPSVHTPSIFPFIGLCCNPGNSRCSASGFPGILELLMLLKQHINSPFKAGTIDFAQVVDLFFVVWIFFLIWCNTLNMFADTVN